MSRLFIIHRNNNVVQTILTFYVDIPYALYTNITFNDIKRKQ